MKTKFPRRPQAAVTKEPIWTDNARAGKEPSIWTLELPDLRVDAHRYLSIEDTWFGSCVSMNISQHQLNSPNIEEAKAAFLLFLQTRAVLWGSTLANAVSTSKNKTPNGLPIT